MGAAEVGVTRHSSAPGTRLQCLEKKGSQRLYHLCRCLRMISATQLRPIAELARAIPREAVSATNRRAGIQRWVVQLANAVAALLVQWDQMKLARGIVCLHFIMIVLGSATVCLDVVVANLPKKHRPAAAA